MLRTVVVQHFYIETRALADALFEDMMCDGFDLGLEKSHSFYSTRETQSITFSKVGYSFILPAVFSIWI